MRNVLQICVLILSLAQIVEASPIFRNGFEAVSPSAEDLTIEFQSDSTLIFSDVGQRRVLNVGVFDALGAPDLGRPLTWRSLGPALVRVTPDGPRSAVIEVLSEFVEPVDIEVEIDQSSARSRAVAVFSKPSPRTILIPSDAVRAISGDRLDIHQLTLSAVDATALIAPGTIVVSGDAAGVMVEVLARTDASDEMALTVRPSPIGDAFESIRFVDRGDPLRVQATFDHGQERLRVFSVPDERLLLEQTRTSDTPLTCDIEASQQIGLSFSAASVERRIEPKVVIDVVDFTVTEIYLGLEGSMAYEIGVEGFANAVASGTITCSYEFSDIVLPGVRASVFHFAPIWTPRIAASVTATATGSASFVMPVVRRERGLTVGARYTSQDGWQAIGDSTSVESETGPISFGTDARLSATLSPQVELDTSISVSLGRAGSPLYLELIRSPFFRIGSGLDYNFAIDPPVDRAQSTYTGPSVLLDFFIDGTFLLERELVSGVLAKWLPTNLPQDLNYTLFEVRAPLHQTMLPTVTLACEPACFDILPTQTPTLTVSATHAPESAGVLELLISKDGSPSMTSWRKAPFNGPLTDLVINDTASLEPGYYELHARLTLEGNGNHYTNLFPLPSAIQPVGAFSIEAIIDEAFLAGFADSSLRDCLRPRLGDPVGEVTYLECQNRGIASLQGIERLFNLSSAYLYGGQISDIAPIASIANLSLLHLGGHRISSIEPLRGHPRLSSLDVHDNQISDISLVEGIPTLTRFGASENAISNIDPLSALHGLTVLNLADNEIASIHPLAGLVNLVEFDISGNPIDDLAPITNFSGLRYFYANRTLVTSLPNLGQLPLLDAMNMNNGVLSDVSGIEGSSSLRLAHFIANDIEDFSPFSNIASLRSLQVSGNEGTSVAPLEGLQHLVFLTVGATDPSCPAMTDLVQSLPTTEIFGDCLCSCSCGQRQNLFDPGELPASCATVCAQSCPPEPN